jgi:hypothetical protein
MRKLLRRLTQLQCVRHCFPTALIQGEGQSRSYRGIVLQSRFALQRLQRWVNPS